MRIGIVGPRCGGKTTLFRAMTEQAPPPAAGSEVGGVPALVPVSDPRLDYLSSIFRPRKHTPAQIQVVDFPGFDLGDASEHKKRILAQFREMDALILVAGAFAEGDTLAKAAETVDAVKFEFFFADLDILDKRIEKLKVGVTKTTKTQEQEKRELEILVRVKEEAEKRESMAGIPLDAGEEKLLRSFGFLSRKPTLVVFNEGDTPPKELPPEARAKCPGAVRLSAKIEQEIAELPEAERGPFLEGLGIRESAGRRLIREIYALLGLASFFTTGEDECRAWTIRAGDDIVTAAGKIHSDLARGFIRAEVYSYDTFRDLGSEKAVKARGLLRTEGKGYLVRDGDVLHILFNVGGR